MKKLTLTQVLAQYPAANEFLDIANFGWRQNGFLTEIHATVESADKDLLRRKPKYLYVAQLDNLRMTASVHEVIGAIDSRHRLVAAIGNWRTDTEPSKTTHQCVGDLLVTSNTKNVAYLVQMVVTCWYNGNDFCKREIEFTVYRARRGTFRKLSESFAESTKSA